MPFFLNAVERHVARLREKFDEYRLDGIWSAEEWERRHRPEWGCGPEPKLTLRQWLNSDAAWRWSIIDRELRLLHEAVALLGDRLLTLEGNEHGRDERDAAG